jgi:hypothetical protein
VPREEVNCGNVDEGMLMRCKLRLEHLYGSAHIVVNVSRSIDEIKVGSCHH